MRNWRPGGRRVEGSADLEGDGQGGDGQHEEEDLIDMATGERQGSAHSAGEGSVQ